MSGFNRCTWARAGYVVYNAHDVYIGQAFERYGEYSEIEARLLRRLCPAGGIAVDLGANIGAHTLALSSAVGPDGFVYAYEPQRVVFQTLCANLALNNITNVDARQAAAGASSGTVLIPDLDYRRRGNFGGVDVSRFTSGRPVRRVALDDDLDVPGLNLLKVDVEGMEREALQGARRLIARCRPYLYVENDRLDRSEALLRCLLEWDYRLYWHQPPLFNPGNFLGATENVYPGIVSVNVLAVPRESPQPLLGLPEVRDPAEHPLRARPEAPR